ncbi:hypothetical protein [Thauera phenolivorans]|uniref:hypothetical protein n=1 Tax=Thauera phenolivorans TaxID=1792543 RepID=UPI001E440B00|nr:hypothetical protein [Thauera phenolivorans]
MPAPSLGRRIAPPSCLQPHRPPQLVERVTLGVEFALQAFDLPDLCRELSLDVFARFLGEAGAGARSEQDAGDPGREARTFA